MKIFLFKMFRYKNGLSQVIAEKKVQCKFMSETLFIYHAYGTK